MQKQKGFLATQKSVLEKKVRTKTTSKTKQKLENAIPNT